MLSPEKQNIDVKNLVDLITENLKSIGASLHSVGQIDPDTLTVDVVIHPVTPIQYITTSFKIEMTWQSYLKNVQHESLIKPNDCVSLNEVQEFMQSKWPGPYVVDWVYSTKSYQMELRPIFEDPKAKTMWMLKYS